MIRQWIQFIRETPARTQAVFLSDYDMSMTEHLVQGVDLWLNTPRRPWEASGTSGMKVLVNGGLNLSELDGWWAEAYTPDVGWAIGDGLEHDSDPAWDAAEAERLYTLLEQEIVPAFYRRDEAGVPSDWVAKMRESMARLTPEFSANRTVRQYTANYYLPAVKAYEERSKHNSADGTAILNWQRHVAEHWPRLRFDDLRVEERNVEPHGNCHVFHVRAYLDEIDPAAVRVELYAAARTGGEPAHVCMVRGEPVLGSMNSHTFTASVPADRPAQDFTPRIVPFHPGALVPLEANQILWYK
jgi:starch phosphorylase